jgi:preprotein translocase subunit SecG
MRDLLIIVLLLDSIAMIGLILLQQGKGADAGAAFGSGGGGSESLFGARGSANFLSRATAIMATIFFVVTLTLAFAPLDGKRAASVTTVAPVETPAAPVEKKKTEKPKAPKKDSLPEVPR